MNERPSYYNSPEKGKEALMGLVEGSPDAFCILAGPSRLHSERGHVASSFAIGDENSRLAIQEGRIDFEKLGVHLTPEEIERVKKSGVPAGGNDRIIAAAKMHAAFPEATLATVTRPRNDDEPTYASLIEEGLLRRGVPEEQILSEGEEAVAVDTITEFKEYIRLWKENGWTNIAFILSKWHVPRATALLNHLEDFSDSDSEEQRELLTEFIEAIRTGELTVQFLDTTSVLSAVSSKFERFFEEELANDPGMRLREAMELAAVEQIEAGTYGNKQLTHKIWEDKP
ncbi:MAG: hypothetical protein RLZZ480_322 [Candidatus Parcubacteria bacterium]|jgi:hypothetical protein